MKEFDQDNVNSKIDFINSNIFDHKLMSLATCDPNHNPWVVVVNFDITKNFEIFWKSSRESEHSKNIYQNNIVSLLIFSSDDDRDFAFYARGSAKEVTDIEELELLVKQKYWDQGRSERKIEEFQGNAPDRIYKCMLSEVYICDKSHKKTLVDINILKENFLHLR